MARKTVTVLASVILIAITTTVFSIAYREESFCQNRALKDFSYRADHLATLMNYFLFERQQDGEDIANSRELLSYFQGRDLGMSSQYGLMASKENIQDLLRRKLQTTTFQDNPVYSRIAVILDGGAPLAVAPSVVDSPPNWSKYRYTLKPKGRIIAEWDGGEPRLIISRPFFYKGKYQAQIVLWIVPSNMLARIRLNHNYLPWDQVFITTWNGQRLVSPFDDGKTSTIFQAMEGSLGPEMLYIGGEKLLVDKSDVPDTALSLFLVAKEEEVTKRGHLKVLSWYVVLLSTLLLWSIAHFSGITSRERDLLRSKGMHRELIEAYRKRLALYRKRIDLLKEIPQDKVVQDRSASNLWNILDRNRFYTMAEMADHQRDLIEGIIRDFLDILPGMTLGVKKAIKDGDRRLLEERCSNLRDALQSIGCSSLGDLCSSIISEAGQGNDEEVARLEKELYRGTDELTEELLKGDWGEHHDHSFDSRR